MTQMSKEAAAALINAGTNRQGAIVDGHAPVLSELLRAGLVGPQFGLTRKGTIARERAVSAALDAAF